MIVYVCLIVLSVGITLGIFLKNALLLSWYNWFWMLAAGVLVFLGLTAVYFLLLYLISLTVDKSRPVSKRQPFYRFLLNETVWLILHLGRVKIRVSGLEKLEGVPRFLLAANHRSNFDPFIAIAVCPKAELAYICKPEILNIPITGRIVHKCFFLPIDRQNNRAALDTIRHAAELLDAGTVSIGVYPEGTRSKTGELLPFRNGAFQIAKRGNAPIVIARTTGTENIAKNFARRTTCVTFEILDVLPAEAAAGMSTCEIGNHARQLILGGAE